MKLTLPKLGLGSPLGLLKFQSSILGVKTPCIGVFFISLEKLAKCRCRKWVRMGHLDICSTSYGQKKSRESKVAVWLLNTKSRESTWPRCVQVECDTPLESFQRGLQVCFKPHPNRRSEQRVMTSQNVGSLNQDNFETPPWESCNKKPFGCGCHGEAQSILYGGRWWLPSSLGYGESKVAHGLS